MTIGKYYDMEDKVYDQREALLEAKQILELNGEPVVAESIKIVPREDNWLSDSFRRANAHLIENLTPMEMATKTGRQVTIPLNDTDAAELLRRFNAHYFAWTGKCLKEVR